MKDNPNQAQYIYNNCKNSIYDKNEGTMYSLANFSKNAASYMTDDPVYNICKYEFSMLLKDGKKFDDEPIGQYSDSIVNDLFEVHKIDKAIEASLIINLWTQFVHELRKRDWVG